MSAFLLLGDSYYGWLCSSGQAGAGGRELVWRQALHLEGGAGAPAGEAGLYKLWPHDDFDRKRKRGYAAAFRGVLRACLCGANNEPLRAEGGGLGDVKVYALGEE